MSYVAYFLINLIGIICNDKLIQTYYSSNVNAPCRIVARTNFSKAHYDMVIDISNEYTWISGSSEDFSKTKSLSIIKDRIEIVYDNHIMKGKEIESSFMITSNESLSIDFNYYAIDDIPHNYRMPRHILGLSFSFSENKYSLIHTYKAKRLIDHLSFSFIKNGSNNYFVLGEKPNDIISNQTHSYCDVIGNDNHWDCLITKVTVYNDLHNEVIRYDTIKGMSDYSVFSTADNYVYAPSEFITRLNDAYFDDLISSRKCVKYSNRNKTQISCMTFNIPLLNIIFYINNASLNFDPMDLWECSVYSSCSFLIVENPLGNYWRLGMSFIQHLDILFDYEDRKIHFYSSIHLVFERNAVNKKMQRYLMLFLIKLLLIANCFISSVKLYLKK